MLKQLLSGLGASIVPWIFRGIALAGVVGVALYVLSTIKENGKLQEQNANLLETIRLNAQLDKTRQVIEAEDSVQATKDRTALEQLQERQRVRELYWQNRLRTACVAGPDAEEFLKKWER